MTEKQKFECESCEHKWLGKAVEDRKTVNYDSEGNVSVKCPNCMTNSGYPVENKSDSGGEAGTSVDVSSEDLPKEEPDIDSGEKAVDDTTRTIEKLAQAKETEQRYKEALEGGDSDFDKLMKIKMLETLDSNNSNSASALKSELQDLRSELKEIKNGSSDNSDIRDQVLEKIIGSLDLEGQLANNNSGLDGSDVQQILDRFQENMNVEGSYPENLPPKLFLELSKHDKEMNVREKEMKQRRKLLDEFFNGLQNFAEQYGVGTGKGIAQFMNQNKNQQNQQQPNSSQQQQREKLEIQPEPVVEDGDLQGFEFDCPSCDSQVLVEPGTNVARCESCGEVFTLAPNENSQKEEMVANAG